MQPEIEVDADVLDVLRSGEPDTGQARRRRKPRPIQAGWKARLLPGQRGPLALVANAITALRYAPEWGGVLSFNESAIQTIAAKAPPFEHASIPFIWADHHDVLAAAWLQHQGIPVAKELAGQAVQTVAREHMFHPIRQYFDALKWDGIPRLDDWLTFCIGAEPTDLNRAVGAKFLMSAVARIYKPGCKVDTCLILEGRQGALKSTALRTLAGDEYFTDDFADLGSKDAVLQMRGKLLIELAELDSLGRAELSRAKAFMSRAVDRVRLPYARRLSDLPRECIFSGTTNKDMYLNDETGARRFWPVKCGVINIEVLRRDRDNLWAEAVARFRAGEVWWLDKKELREAAASVAEDRREADVWQGLIDDWVKNPKERRDDSGHPLSDIVSGPGFVTVHDVLMHCVGKSPSSWTRADQMRVSACLIAKGWKRLRQTDGNRLWGYVPPCE
jgi:putative DNA primase/helicase